MAIENKNEIRAYFELNTDSPKQVAARFKISYRTLMHWIKNEGWVRGKARACIEPQVLSNELLKKEFASVRAISSENIKQGLRANLSPSCALDELVLNNMLEQTTEKLLLDVVSLDFVQKNIALSALIAKDELMRAVALRDENKPDFAIVAAAEKVNNIFTNLGLSLFGKAAFEKNVKLGENDFEKMSEAELLQLYNAKS